MKSISELLRERSNEIIMNMDYEIECPICHNIFCAKNGTNICPNCLNNITLNINKPF